VSAPTPITKFGSFQHYAYTRPRDIDKSCLKAFGFFQSFLYCQMASVLEMRLTEFGDPDIVVN